MAAGQGVKLFLVGPGCVEIGDANDFLRSVFAQCRGWFNGWQGLLALDLLQVPTTLGAEYHCFLSDPEFILCGSGVAHHLANYGHYAMPVDCAYVPRNASRLRFYWIWNGLLNLDRRWLVHSHLVLGLQLLADFLQRLLLRCSRLARRNRIVLDCLGRQRH